MSRPVSMTIFNKLVSVVKSRSVSLEKKRISLAEKIKANSLSGEKLYEEYVNFIVESSKSSGVLLSLKNEIDLLLKDLEANLTSIPQEIVYGIAAKTYTKMPSQDSLKEEILNLYENNMPSSSRGDGSKN